jgi:hypothetical protein
VPGTTDKTAVSSAFGAVFTDVDFANMVSAAAHQTIPY